MVGSWSADSSRTYGVFIAGTEGHAWMQYIGSPTLTVIIGPIALFQMYCAEVPRIRIGIGNLAYLFVPGWMMPTLLYPRERCVEQEQLKIRFSALQISLLRKGRSHTRCIRNWRMDA